MVALPVVLHTKLTGKIRVRSAVFGRYVIQVEELFYRGQAQVPPRPGSSAPMAEPPSIALSHWRDAREEDSWLLRREGLL